MPTIQELTSVDDFKTIKGLWDELLEKTDDSPLFLSHEWFECCLHGFQKNKELLILLIKDGEDIIGIAPLWLYNDTVRGIKVRKIGFITIPDSPFADFIVKRDRHEEILQLIINYLFAKKKTVWDTITLNRWPAISPNNCALQKIISSQKKKYLLKTSSLTPYISIQDNWESFLKGRSTKFRKTHRNIINRINKLKNVEVQCFRKDITGTLLKEIINVSKQSWKDKSDIAISSRKETVLFFEALNDIAGQRGWLFVWILKIDNISIAMEYNLIHEGKVYALRADFDESYKKVSPGVYLEYHIIKKLFEEGYSEYNAGPGMNAYKLHWTDQIKENITFQIFNNNLKGSIIWALEGKLFPFLRNMRGIKTKII